MNNVLYSKVAVTHAYSRPRGTVVGAAVTQESNGYIAWKIVVEGDGESYRHELDSHFHWGREDALERAVLIVAQLRGAQ